MLLAATALAAYVCYLLARPFLPALVTQRLVREAVGGARAVMSEVESGHWRASVEGSPRMAQALSWVEGQANVGEELRRLSGVVTERLSAYVTGSLWAVVELLLTLFALFYFFRDRSAVLRKLRSLVPLSGPETDKIFSRVKDTIHATHRHDGTATFLILSPDAPHGL